MAEDGEISPTPQSNNPLHGVRLIDVLEFLQKKYGWKKLGEKIPIRCFTHDPSINSSLKFLRKTDWARTKVEALYIRTKELDQAKEAKNGLG
jgi:uncharacterized protein (DUF2132 family)